MKIFEETGALETCERNGGRGTVHVHNLRIYYYYYLK